MVCALHYSARLVSLRYRGKWDKGALSQNRSFRFLDSNDIWLGIAVASFMADLFLATQFGLVDMKSRLNAVSTTLR